MMNAQIPNLEEAANIAAEFIYSVDNLPGEVSHLLQEIRHRESRTVDLQQEIDKDSAKYIRHSHCDPSAPTTPPSPSSRAPSPKATSIPVKISASYAEIQELAAEKCALAQQLIDLLSKTRAKLDIDIVKVRMLQGESPEIPTVSSRSNRPLVVTPVLDNFGSISQNPALAVSESIRSALALPLSADPPSVVSTSSSGPATKKRRLNATNSIKITPAVTPTKHRSASPAVTLTTAHVTQQKSRLSRQIIPPAEDPDMDADGDDDAEEDETLYCICQKQSYGDMIACDNEDGCPYEWFHLACVGLKQPTPEKWYCSACSKDKGIPPTTRKGRRK